MYTSDQKELLFCRMCYDMGVMSEYGDDEDALHDEVFSADDEILGEYWDTFCDEITFTVYDFSDYFGYLYLESCGYEFSVDVDGCYDDDAETWDENRVREQAEQAVKAAFGPSASIKW